MKGTPLHKIVGTVGCISQTPATPSDLQPTLQQALLEEQQKDAFVTEEQWKQRNARAPEGGPQLQWHISPQDGLLRFGNRIFVPSLLRQEILQIHHHGPFGGHQGVTKTKRRIKRSYIWDQLRTDVSQAIRTCRVCQQTKSRHHRPYGLLQPLPIPTTPWRDISVDFITSLPESLTLHGKKANSILVIVDRLTKYALYIPTTMRLTSEGLADILLHHVVKFFGIPDSIVSDRGTLFTSDFWSTFCRKLGILRRLSTAYHPQTDGQTERQHQSLEHYLRVYCNEDQDDWASHLTLAELVYNTSWHSAINTTPAEALYGFLPRLPQQITDVPPENNDTTAEERTANLQRRHGELVDTLKRTNEQYAKWYNNGRTDKRFAVGDWVLLSTKRLNLRRPCRKLDNKYIGPYQIEGLAGYHGLAYELRLPTFLKINPVFPISAIEPYIPRDDETPTSPIDIPFVGDQAWEIEEILAHKGTKSRRKYWVKWAGFPEEENSWVTKADIDDAEMVKQYEAKFL